MKGFIIATIYLISSALIWYIIYNLLIPIVGDGDGLKAAITFGWLASIVITIMAMIYYANSDPKLKEIFKKINN